MFENTATIWAHIHEQRLANITKEIIKYMGHTV